MKRTGILCLAFLVGYCSADRGDKSGPNTRSNDRAEVVPVNEITPRAQPEKAEAASAAAVGEPPASQATKVLCDRTYAKTHAPLVSWPPPGLKTKVDAGKVWVNFWAGWCKPCVEELPRVRAFAAAEHTALILISLDDDERQWRAAAKQLGLDALSDGERQIWLSPGPRRQQWLAQLKLGDPPVLPGHAFLEKQHLLCYRTGAIDAEDRPLLDEFFR